MLPAPAALTLLLWLLSAVAATIPTSVRVRRPEHERHGSRAKKTRRNVLFIMSDDLRPELSCYAQPRAHTPHIAELAQRALRFDRAYTQMAVCAPARQAILTGRRPDTSGVWNFIDWFRNVSKGAESWQTIPEYFRSHGYTALGLGKTFHGCSDEITMAPSNRTLIELGFCDTDRSWSTEVLPYLPFKLEYCPGEVLANRSKSFCRVDDETKIFDSNLTAAAVSAIERAAGLDRPWFVAVGYKKPHAPWGIPSRFFDQWDASKLPIAAHPVASTGVPSVALIENFLVKLENGTAYPWQPRAPLPVEIAQMLRQAYYAAVSFVDEQVGKLLAHVDALGLRQSTVVVFVADHGYHLGEHGEWEKKTNFELTTRVPLLIAAPDYTGSHGKSTTALLDLVDLYPTITDLAGLPPPSSEPWLDSDSVSQIRLFNSAVDDGPRRYSFSQYPRCGDAGSKIEQGSCNMVDKRDFKYMGFTVRSARWRYTAWMVWNQTTLAVDWQNGPPYAEELYDHAGDDGTSFDRSETRNMLAPGWQPSATAAAARDELYAVAAKRFSSAPPRV